MKTTDHFNFDVVMQQKRDDIFETVRVPYEDGVPPIPDGQLDVMQQWVRENPGWFAEHSLDFEEEEYEPPTRESDADYGCRRYHELADEGRI